MITHAELSRRLALATAETIRCARDYVIESLPDVAVFDLRLIPSWHGDEPVFDPAFASYWRRASDGQLGLLTSEQLLGELWHDGRAPEWIDLSVIDVDDVATRIEARFSRTLARHFDVPEPRTIYQEVCPFQIRGPYFPPGFDHETPGLKFSLGARTQGRAPKSRA